MLYNNIFFFIESFLLNLYIHFGFVLMLKVDLLIHHILFLKQNRIYLLILYSLKKSTMDYNFLKDLLNGKLQILIQGIFESECHNIQYNGRVQKDVDLSTFASDPSTNLQMWIKTKNMLFLGLFGSFGTKIFIFLWILSPS